MKLSTILVLFTTAVVGIVSAAETNGNLRAIVDSVSILKQDSRKSNESREDRIATTTYAEGIRYCTDPGRVSRTQASNLSRNEVRAKVDDCIEQAIDVATAGNSTQRSVLDPPTDCAHNCGDEAARSFKPVSRQCSGSLDKCKSCKKKDKKCSMDFMNFKKDEEKKISKKDADANGKTDEEKKKLKDLAKCLKDKANEEKKYIQCVKDEKECEEDRDDCEREQKRAQQSLERMPREFDKCIRSDCPISDTLSGVKMA